LVKTFMKNQIINLIIINSLITLVTVGGVIICYIIYKKRMKNKDKKNVTKFRNTNQNNKKF